MKLYLDEKEYEVPLYSILTQALYDKVTPILDSLANSKGSKSAFESMLQERMLQDAYFMDMAKKMQDGDKLDYALLQKDFKFQELVGECIIKVKTDLFEYIFVDDETIPLIFDLAKTAIDIKKVNDASLLNGIESDATSEFWQQQDIHGVLETLTIFRKTILRRIRSGF